jgi:hypothetical protein
VPLVMTTWSELGLASTAAIIARARQIRLPSPEGAARRHTECHKGAAAEGFMPSRVIFRVFLTSRGVAQPG